MEENRTLDKEIIILAFYINNDFPFNSDILRLYLKDLIDELNNNNKYIFKIIPIFVKGKTEIKCIFPFIPKNNNFKKDIQILNKNLLEIKDEYSNNDNIVNEVKQLIRLLKIKSMDIRE